MQVQINELIKIYNYEVSKNTKNKHRVYNFEKYKLMNITTIIEELQNNNYTLGQYNIFYISEPKIRIIMSLSIKDRIIDHYISQKILFPKLEKYLDIRNIASRKNMGLSYGIKLLKKYLEENKKHKEIYALKIDISKFFYTIDHEVLKQMLKNKLTEEEHKLVSMFIDSTDKNYINEEIKYIKNKLLLTALTKEKEQEILEIPYYQPGKGLTIGNICSQVLSIFYLSEIDFYIIHNLKCKYMIRYCDDFIIFHHNKKYLEEVLKLVKNKLSAYKLKANPKKCNIVNLKNGVIFCGYLIKIDNKKTIIKKSRKSKDRLRYNLKRNQKLYLKGQITFKKYFNSIASHSSELTNKRL